MDIILRGVARLIGHAQRAATGLVQEQEDEYKQARSDFDAECVETERLLEERERMVSPLLPAK